MLGLLMIAFIVVPIIELYLFIQVSSAIGFGAALLWIVLVSVIGAWLVKREGLQALRRANEKVASGQIPTDELITGILILCAGALMLTPGFLTDVVGVFLLFPPTRALLRNRLRGRFASGPILIGRFGGPDGFTRGPSPARGDVWDAESWEDPPNRQELD
ncbi:FxsA family protein [Actinospongicola halichondriae]|uniref:FxsA family protein n=1 Tax=Actinospongicola halichondriae TaxID=3236844 RepID=UPI003D5C68D0